ncbi:MAG: hypothetical protein EAZ14_12105 [Runella slithyformis]|nr:MAG: hypothetical protein EAZ14_12105 [Runella slithyformis]
MPALNPIKVKVLLVTLTFLGLLMPVVVKLNGYVPLDKLVLVKAIVPSVPLQVVGFVNVPAVSVGTAGFDKIFEVATEPIQPERVTEKLL